MTLLNRSKQVLAGSDTEDELEDKKDEDLLMRIAEKAGSMSP